MPMRARRTVSNVLGYGGVLSAPALDHTLELVALGDFSAEFSDIHGA